MRAALREARKGAGRTDPNPAVGAVIVRRGKIVASGWHRRAGAPHAEIEALRALPDPAMAQGATLYVTLEPCSTRGKTPPCTDAITSAGLRRVVYGATDPNPRHAGRAAGILESEGIKVTAGVLAAACAQVNEAWNVWIATGLPLVIAKAGMSLDGRISSPPGRRWITSPEARADAMALRASCDAILVGGQTIRDDNPRLTVRGAAAAARTPLRAVWTQSGNLPPGARIFHDGGPTRVFCNVPLRSCLRALARAGVRRVLIEGGGRVLGEAFDRNLVDRVVFYVAPVLLGGPVVAVGGRGAGRPDLSAHAGPIKTKILGGTLRLEAAVISKNSRTT
jgi:diaminohydroxyphosphoribosylaminopyrimidine deaminase / 5-amino-6-(5-phosphoribosylamino)uracil reductase